MEIPVLREYMRGRLVVVSVVVVILLAWIAYRFANREAFVAQGALPAPPDQVTFAGGTPEHPFKLEAGNILSRTVFRTAVRSNAEVEVRDVMLPPHAKSQLQPLPGPALLDTYSGEGTISLGEKAERLSAGQMRSVPAGQALSFDNPGAYPLVLRFYVFEGK
jgi:quercetin dioxygenase-like cupin family protein